MSYSVFPAPSVAASKILKKLTLTSGTSYTVPAGVTDINVTLYGGGGGGGAAMFNSGAPAGNGGTGGTTTFTGATSAPGGAGGLGASHTGGGSYYSIHTTPDATANTGKGGQCGFTLTTVGANKGDNGYDGTVISSTLTVTPGQIIGYSIGSGGTAGSGHSSGGAGGSGKIEIEYWV
jgi:hypothetical protein